MLPSARAIRPHLTPTVIAVRRTKAGIEVVEQRTLPGPSLAIVASMGAFWAMPMHVQATAPRRMPQSRFSPSAGAEAIKMYDANHDGKISGEELDKCPALKAALAQIDPAGKGEITADMIDARVRDWVDSKLARMTISCTVLRNGKPLPGATVKFVPEKFLGPNVQPGTGKTDTHGIAMLSVALSGREPPGMGPGLYRVVITKEGAEIPEKYSTEANTVLGREVARDAEGIQNMQGIKFNLKF